MNLRNLGSVGGGGELSSDENLSEARDVRVEFLARIVVVWRLRVVRSMVAFTVGK